mgnify:FL=1
MKVIEVKKRGALYEETIDLLIKKYDKKNRSREFWINRFERSESNRIGYLLEINLELVGFIGLIESNNMIGLSTWFVDGTYRKHSMSFLSRVMSSLKESKIVNSSPNPIALKIFQKLYSFTLNNEFIGLPKKILGFSKSYTRKIHFGEKINVCYDGHISLFAILFFTVKYKKICVALTNNKSKLFLNKKINVLSKNINYYFPLSIHGDIFE